MNKLQGKTEIVLIAKKNQAIYDLSGCTRKKTEKRNR